MIDLLGCVVAESPFDELIRSWNDDLTFSSFQYYCDHIQSSFNPHDPETSSAQQKEFLEDQSEVSVAYFSRALWSW